MLASTRGRRAAVATTSLLALAASVSSAGAFATDCPFTVMALEAEVSTMTLPRTGFSASITSRSAVPIDTVSCASS